jgi:hypothetical protein
VIRGFLPETIWKRFIIKERNMERIPDVTAGEILSEEFLLPMNITAYRLSKDTGMPATRVSEIIKGRRKKKQRVNSSEYPMRKLLSWANCCI